MQLLQKGSYAYYVDKAQILVSIIVWVKINI